MGFIEVYGLLAGIGILWTLFASVQDWKTTEVSNWLTFSLIGFGLAYRAFYALNSNAPWFFVSGLIGFGVFFVLAHLFYYARVFGGGDAKLMIGLGVVLPYGSVSELVSVGFGFLVLFLFVSALYGLVFSFILICKNFECFKKVFLRKFLYWRKWLLISLPFGAVLVFFGWFNPGVVGGGILIGVLPLVYAGVKALDECMIVEKNPWKLLEGDWLVNDVSVRGKLIKKSVHGLSLEDIKVLRKSGKKVLIKEGIVFAPVFLISFVMVCALKFSGVLFLSFLV